MEGFLLLGLQPWGRDSIEPPSSFLFYPPFIKPSVARPCLACLLLLFSPPVSSWVCVSYLARLLALAGPPHRASLRRSSISLLSCFHRLLPHSLRSPAAFPLTPRPSSPRRFFALQGPDPSHCLSHYFRVPLMYRFPLILALGRSPFALLPPPFSCGRFLSQNHRPHIAARLPLLYFSSRSRFVVGRVFSYLLFPLKVALHFGVYGPFVAGMLYSYLRPPSIWVQFFFFFPSLRRLAASPFCPLVRLVSCSLPLPPSRLFSSMLLAFPNRHFFDLSSFVVLFCSGVVSVVPGHPICQSIYFTVARPDLIATVPRCSVELVGRESLGHSPGLHAGDQSVQIHGFSCFRGKFSCSDLLCSRLPPLSWFNLLGTALYCCSSPATNLHSLSFFCLLLCPCS